MIELLLMILIELNNIEIANTHYEINNDSISTCEIDLNKDRKDDIVLLIDTKRGQELIVLICKKVGYRAFLVVTDKSKMCLRCTYGDTVTETSAGKGKKTGKKHKTPGAYIELYQPEGASVVYYWNGNGFTEVWTSD